ncbi:MAG: helix-turn-helix domain-containing protein [Burkholderiales bacterium]
MTSEQFGNAVREARKLAHLTQAEAAALCGVSTPFLSHLENGKTTIQLQKALHVATELGLQLSFHAGKWSGHEAQILAAEPMS